jgi:hypothetical protein
VCRYYRAGYPLTVDVQDNRIAKVTSPPFDHDVRPGDLCVKGRNG